MISDKMIELADFTVEEIKRAGNEEGQVFITESESTEFVLRDGQYNTCCTIFSNDINVIVMREHKKGAHYLNKADKESAVLAVKTATQAMEAAESDEANKIAPNQGKIDKVIGTLEPDLEKLFFRMEELRATVEKDYPLISVGSITAIHSKRDMVYKNTNGTICFEQAGSYNMSMEFAGRDGEKITSFNACGVTMYELDKPIIECGDYKKTLELMEKQLEARDYEGKFAGTVLMNAGAVSDFVNYLISIGAGGAGILDGTSVWLGKLEKKVASEKLTISMDPHDERIIRGETLTFDGFKSEQYYIIEKGILKNYRLGYYHSEKTGYKRAGNLGNDIIIEAGDMPYEDMIKNIKKGIIADGFSGGYPAINGDFSGVAKNSLLIEDGRITGAVKEVMISGNIFELFNSIKDISKQQYNYGWGVFPCISFDEVVISGK